MTTSISPASDGPGPATPPRKESRSWWLWLEASLEQMFILFSLYVLSIGPLYWEYLNARHAHGFILLAAFYEPLRILGEIFPLFGKCVNWYISLWVG